jgi:hypothetical protein
MPPSLLKTILVVPTLTHTQEDCLFWHPSHNSQFTSSSAYHIALVSDNPSQPVESWQRIWKLNIIPSVTSFLWLICHDRLPTKVLLLLLRKKILIEDLCPLCKATPETLPHFLRDCPLVKPIWLSIGVSTMPHFFLTLMWKLGWRGGLAPL